MILAAMDTVQLLNGTAAFAAFCASMYAFVRFHDGRWWMAWAVHIVNGSLLMWYTAVNLTAGSGLWDAEQRDLVPLFRWAFAPLLLSYTARVWLAGRRQRRGEI